MGIFDKVSEAVAGNADQIKEGIEKAGDFVDEKTDGKFAGQVDQAQSFAADQVDKLAANGEA